MPILNIISFKFKFLKTKIKISNGSLKFLEIDKTEITDHEWNRTKLGKLLYIFVYAGSGSGQTQNIESQI
jgi:hypothetical protein